MCKGTDFWDCVQDATADTLTVVEPILGAPAFRRVGASFGLFKCSAMAWRSQWGGVQVVAWGIKITGSVLVIIYENKNLVV